MTPLSAIHHQQLIHPDQLKQRRASQFSLPPYLIADFTIQAYSLHFIFVAEIR